MTSTDTEIQELYNKIKNYKSIIVKKKECIKNICICDEINNIRRKDPIPLTEELDSFLKIILSIKLNLKSNPYKYDTPFSKFRDYEDDPIWGDLDYQIVFINDGIRLFMTRDMVSKISILNSILLDKNGSDKPIRLKHIDARLGKLFNGPYLYITKLPLESLIFNKPPNGYSVRAMRINNEPNLTSYFKYENVAEAIYNDMWY